jgi:hypothetical protein
MTFFTLVSFPFGPNKSCNTSNTGTDRAQIWLVKFAFKSSFHAKHVETTWLHLNSCLTTNWVENQHHLLGIVSTLPLHTRSSRLWSRRSHQPRLPRCKHLVTHLHLGPKSMELITMVQEFKGLDGARKYGQVLIILWYILYISISIPPFKSLSRWDLNRIP